MSSLLNVLYSETDAVGYAFFGVLVIFFIIFLILMFCVAITAVVLGIIGQWKMFEKADEKGWKSLIPVYNLYTACKVVGVNPWWIAITWGISIIYVIVNSISGAFPDAWYLVIFVVIFGLLNFAASLYFAIILAVSTARSYGKDSGWAVGLYFLKPFFMFALGVGKSKYVGATPMNDPILKSTASVNNAKNDSKKGTTKGSKFCSNCGAKITIKDKFCPECGTKK